MKEKKEPWRVGVALASVAFIVFMFIKKGIVISIATMPKEQLLPLFATNVAVTLFKIAGIAAAVLAVKWFISKVRKK